MTSNLQQKMFIIITVKNERVNVNTHCNLLYALKVWNYFSLLERKG